LGDFLSVNETQLQYLVDRVAEIVDEKHKYYAKINLRRTGAIAWTWEWIRGRTNRRRIEVGRDKVEGLLGSEEKRHSLINSIVEEIAHFKAEGRRYRHKDKWVPRHKYHTKSFQRAKDNLMKALEPRLQELIKLDLPVIQPAPPKPKPSKEEVIKRKLADVQEHIKKIERRIKRFNTSLKKWRRRERYYQKQLRV